MRHGLVALSVLALVLALGCDQGFDDATTAPMCMSDMGCPSGTVCVDGVRCEAMPDASIPRSPPRFDLIGPGQRPGRVRRDGGTQADAGTRVRDAGTAPPTGLCATGQTLCGSLCVNLLTDVNNCGGCGVTCIAGQFCSQGFCCGGTQVVCGTQCVDLQTDPQNCGVCGFQCINGLACVQATCTPPSPIPLPF